MIREMRESDIPAVVDLYSAFMFDSFLSRLGKDFLRQAFEGIIKSKHGISYVWTENSAVGGFIVSATDSPALFREVFRKRIAALSKAAILAAIKDPALMLKLAESFLYFKRTELKGIKAELLFISIDQANRGKGVARELIARTFLELRRKLISKAKVTTQKNNSAVNRLLQGLGFNPSASFYFYGKESLLYEITVPDK